MLPTFFGFSRYPTDQAAPGQAFLWWLLSRGQLEHAITHVSGCHLDRAGLTGEAFDVAGNYGGSLTRSGPTGDKLES